MTSSPITRYGVKEQISNNDSTSGHVEQLRLRGFTVVDGGYNVEKQKDIAEGFTRSYQLQAERHGGRKNLVDIDEHNTIRAPFLYDKRLLELAQNDNVLAVARSMFGGSHAEGAFILNQQNGIINPAHGQSYNQAAFHRDLPYQHFVSSRPLAINALYCVDPFTTENGATFVIAGSHREEKFPSDPIVRECSEQVAAPAGSFLVLDCMVYHCGGVNQTAKQRRAVNHLYALPFIRQQINLLEAMDGRDKLRQDEVKLLGGGNQVSANPSAFFAERLNKLRGES